MGCVCGRPAAIDDGRCGETPQPLAKFSAGVAVVRTEEEARKQARARDEALERRRAAAMAVAACQVRSPVPRVAEAEQVAAGWPPWLVAVAAEAVRGWVPRRAESFEKLDKVTLSSFLRFLVHALLVLALVSAQ
jgi:cyclin-dependent kinase 12/13